MVLKPPSEETTKREQLMANILALVAKFGWMNPLMIALGLEAMKPELGPVPPTSVSRACNDLVEQRLLRKDDMLVINDRSGYQRALQKERCYQQEAKILGLDRDPIIIDKMSGRTAGDLRNTPTIYRLAGKKVSVGNPRHRAIPNYYLLCEVIRSAGSIDLMKDTLTEYEINKAVSESYQDPNGHWITHNLFEYGNGYTRYKRPDALIRVDGKWYWIEAESSRKKTVEYLHLAAMAKTIENGVIYGTGIKVNGIWVEGMIFVHGFKYSTNRVASYLKKAEVGKVMGIPFFRLFLNPKLGITCYDIDYQSLYGYDYQPGQPKVLKKQDREWAGLIKGSYFPLFEYNPDPETIYVPPTNKKK